MLSMIIENTRIYDEDMKIELEEEVQQFEEQIDQYELQLLLDGPHDANNAILELHPGAGGTESQDWVSMLQDVSTLL